MTDVQKLITRLETLRTELVAEGNAALAARVEGAIDGLRRCEAGPACQAPSVEARLAEQPVEGADRVLPFRRRHVLNEDLVKVRLA